MLSQQKNEQLTRVGPGTPMGRLMREYWVPALLSEELPSRDCPPVRTMLLCERLIAFRDSNGQVGLFPEKCPHRGASFFFGRSENCGLRCAYHGWKFDVTGACMETPTEPNESPLKRNIRVQAYPCEERCGVVWAYLGPRPVPPSLPNIEVNMEGTAGRVKAIMLENNWLQSVEGDIDVAHVPYLHRDNYEAFEEILGSKYQSVWKGSSHTSVEVADTPGGFAFAESSTSSEQSANGTEGQKTWDIGHFLFPFYSNLPYGELGMHWLVARVPMDDNHTMTFGMWGKDAVTAPPELMLGESLSKALLPNTTDWFGRFRLARDISNDFLVDREHARQSGGCGIAGQMVQDAAITASMGPLATRRDEHLGSRDIGVVHLRKRLAAVMHRLDEEPAPGVDNPGAYRFKHGSLTIARQTNWYDALRRADGVGVTTQP